MTKSSVQSLMVHYLGCSQVLAESTIVRKCISMWGATPDLVLSLWEELDYCRKVPKKGRIVHLLWTLNFLKTYNTWSVLSGTYGVTENTYTHWVWAFLEAIASLQHLVSATCTCTSTYFYLFIYFIILVRCTYSSTSTRRNKYCTLKLNFLFSIIDYILHRYLYLYNR